MGGGGVWTPYPQGSAPQHLPNFFIPTPLLHTKDVSRTSAAKVQEVSVPHMGWPIPRMSEPIILTQGLQNQ